MLRSLSVPIVCFFLLCFAAHSSAQKDGLPLLYSLPPDGTWVEFRYEEISGYSNHVTKTGTLRISSVGSKRVMGAPHRWIEIKTVETYGGETSTSIQKLLAAEEAIREKQSLLHQVPEAYLQYNDGSVARYTPREIDRVLRSNLSSAERVKKKQSRAEDTQIDTKLGKLKTRHIPRTLLNIAGRTIEDEFWLAEEVPFGWAKYEFTVKGRGQIIEIDRWEVSQTGKGAKSDVDESVTNSPRPAYLYSLPPDGTWVEFDVKYEIQGKGIEGMDVNAWAGTLRVSSVGKKDVKGEPYRWIEIKLVYMNGDKIDTYWVTKLLVAEQAIPRGDFKGLVAEGYEKNGFGGRIKKLSPRRRESAPLFPATFPDNLFSFKLIKDQEPIVTKLGRFKAKHLMVSSSSDYHIWLTNENPFGWAKRREEGTIPFAEDSRLITTFEASRTGNEAKSQLNEEGR